MNCPNCKKDRLSVTTSEATRTVDGVLYTARVAADKCAACRSVYFHGPGLEAFERAIAMRIAQQGPMGPEGLVFMREQLGMMGRELAAVLDVSAMHLSRWENGKRSLDRAAWLLVGQMVLDQFGGTQPLLERMEALDKPSSRRRILLDMQGAA